MNYDAKPDNIFKAKKVGIYLHEKCIILNLDSRNVLYEFQDCDKLSRDLTALLKEEQVNRVKEFLEHNSTKIKFTKKSSSKDQLSLF